MSNQRLVVDIGTERLTFWLIAGVVYREVFGGRKHICCDGGHLQCGSAVYAQPDTFKVKVDRWVSQLMERRNSVPKKKRKK